MQSMNVQLLLLAVTEIDLKFDWYAQVPAWAFPPLCYNSNHVWNKHIYLGSPYTFFVL